MQLRKLLTVSYNKIAVHSFSKDLVSRKKGRKKGGKAPGGNLAS